MAHKQDIKGTTENTFAIASSDSSRSTPPSGHAIIYPKSTGIFSKNSAGVETLLSNITNNFIYIRDEKSNTTDGGTFTSGAWRTRTLNTVSYGNGLSSGITLSSNEFTFDSSLYGNWLLQSRAPCFGVDEHRSRIYNVDTSNQILISATRYSQLGSYISDDSLIIGIISPAAGSDTFRLEHCCQTTHATYGFGGTGTINLGVEIYSEVFLMRIN